MSQQPQEDEFHPHLDLKLWRRVFSHALPYKRFLIPLAITAVFIALADASFALVTRTAIDDVVMHGAAASIARYAIVYSGLTAVLATGVWTFIMMAGNLSNHMSHDIRRESFNRLQELEFSYFDHRPIGWLISRLTSDCDKLARIIAWGFLDLVWASCLVSAIAVILVILNWKLGLLILAVLPPLALVSRVFQKKLLLSARETRKYNSLITASYNEGIAGMRTTKSLVRETENLAEFETLSTQMYRASVRNALQSAVYLPIVLTLGSVAAGLALWYGGHQVLSGMLTVGTLVAFISYAGQFFNPVNQIANILVQMQGAQAAGERVISLLDTVPKIRDLPEVNERLRHFAENRAAGTAPDGHPNRIDQIAFDHVSFAYGDGPPVLTDFNLSVESGQTIALVGPSGGGKSTIVNIAGRFYEPTEGYVRINGIDYRQRSLSWLQSQLGIVLQTPHLFGGSVRENIRYGRLDATDAEVEDAARLVNAHDFISAMENGYDTEVGEGGNRLSTGQKQLLSFARALLANPQVFIMDEATSSIDTETERMIQDALKNVFRGRISFVIAHRLSTIRSADRILVINQGRIEENGTHDELIAQKGHYYELYTSQFRREQETEILEAG